MAVRARILVARSRARGAGFNLVEILVAMSIVLVLAATANLYYGAILPQQKIGRAKADIQQLKKAVGYLKNSYPGPLTSEAFRYYEDGPPWVEGTQLSKYSSADPANPDPTLEKLVKFQIVPKVPYDPWDGEYRIDVEKGWIYSPGPDGSTGTDDDVIDSYQPEFTVLRGRLSARSRYLEVDFTRELTREVSAPVTDASEKITGQQSLFQLSKDHFSVTGIAVTTATIAFDTPFTVKLVLASTPGEGSVSVKVTRETTTGMLLRSADGTVLSVGEVELRRESASSRTFVPAE